MKRIICALLLIVLTIPLVDFKFSVTNTLNVTDFGATGNGTTDDTQSINNCLSAARSQNKSIFFPTGIYKCNNLDASGFALKFDIGGLNNITISGQNATILTTKDTPSVQLYISASSRSKYPIISGLTFKNTHGKIVGRTQAIFIAGTSNQYVDTASIINCTFSGFSNDLGGQGINGYWLQNDTLISPNGHDNAEQNANPAIGVLLSDNASGYIKDVEIRNCIWNGYSGTLPMNCKRPKDGFIYGTCYGFQMFDCDVYNFAEEAIFLQPTSTKPSNTSAQVKIIGVRFHAALPPNCLNDDNSKHKVNYGTRVDIDSSTIIGCVYDSVTWGIMHRGIDYTGLATHNYSFINNTFTIARDTSTYTYQGGIFMQGSSAHINDINVHGNKFSYIDSNPVSILNADNVIQYYNPFSSIKIP